MRILSTFCLIIISFIANSQEWKKSLMDARNNYKNGQFSEAVQNYRKAIATAPKELDLSEELAQAYYKSREFKAAEKEYEKSLSSDKNKKTTASKHYNIGNSRMKSRNYSGAIDAFKQALRLNPNDEKTKYNLSEAIRRLKSQKKKDQKKPISKEKDKNQNKEKDQKKDNQKNKNKQAKKPDSKNDKGSLSERAVDRMLDKLMKDETATKRKINKNKQASSNSKSSKDW
ncbi:MAG: tetratricopeptide repeat protein [Flavobacteriia bacterium]